MQHSKFVGQQTPPKRNPGHAPGNVHIHALNYVAHWIRVRYL